MTYERIIRIKEDEKRINYFHLFLSFRFFLCIRLFLFCFIRFIHLSNPSARGDVTQDQFLKRNLQSLNSEFFFSLTGCYTKVKENNLLFYLPLSGVRIVWFILFAKLLCEIQTASSRFWTRVASPFSSTATVAPRAPDMFFSYISLFLHCQLTNKL